MAALTANETIGPTPKSQWVVAGDECISSGGMRGRVVRVNKASGVPSVYVKWENGHSGRVSITLLRLAQ